MKLSWPMIVALAVAGICLCGVSVWYTVDLLRTLGADKTERSLMTVTAIGFEACKFTFVPISLALYAHKKHGRATALLTLGGALLAVSMVASLGFLAAKTDQGIETAKIESDEYKSYQSRLKTIDQSITMLSSAAAIDASSQWRKARENASKRVAEMKALEQERSQTLQAMASIDATAKTETGALFTALGNGWGMSAERVKKLCYIIVAALLELCSIAALSLAGVAAIKVASPSSPTTKRRRSLPRFSMPRLGAWLSKSTASKSASQSAATASVKAPVASTEAVESESALDEKRFQPEAPTIESASKSSASTKAVQEQADQQLEATVLNFQAFAKERKRAVQEADAARKAKVDALKAHSAMSKEAKSLSDQAQKLREEVAEHTAMLKEVKRMPAEQNIMPPKKPKKRLKAPSPQAKIAFDQSLYLLMKHEVESGQLKESIRAIQKAHNIGFKKAQMYFHQLVKDGVVMDQQLNNRATS